MFRSGRHSKIKFASHFLTSFAISIASPFIRSIFAINLSITNVTMQDAVTAILTGCKTQAALQSCRFRRISGHSWTVHLIRSISAVQTSITDKSSVDTPSPIFTQEVIWKNKGLKTEKVQLSIEKYSDQPCGGDDKTYHSDISEGMVFHQTHRHSPFCHHRADSGRCTLRLPGMVQMGFCNGNVNQGFLLKHET